MSAQHPEANAEYSRGTRAFRAAAGSPGRRRGRSQKPGRAGARSETGDLLRPPLARALGALAALAALILLAAEFTTLFAVSTAASAGAVRSVMTGAHHDWALLPIALLSGILALMLWRRRDRSTLLPIALLGVVTLVIALALDLPSAQQSGLLRVAGGGYQIGTAAPRVGMYLETLGAILLIVAGGAGLLLGPASSRAARSGSRED